MEPGFFTTWDVTKETATIETVSMETTFFNSTVGRPSTSANVSNAEVEYCAMVEFWSACVTIYVITVLGIVGNSLSIATFWNQQSNNAMITLLIALAFLDNNILVVNAVMQSAPALCTYYQIGDYFMKWVFPYMWIYVWQILDLNYMASTWMIVMVTWQRYIAVCKPHQLPLIGTVRQAKIKIVVIIVLSTLFVLPQYFDDTVTLTNDPEKPVLVKREAKLSAAAHYIYLVALYYLLVYVIPFGLLIYFTGCLVHTIWKNRQKREKMTRSRLNEAQKTWMLLMVVFVFMICQLTSPIRRTIIAVTGRQSGCNSLFFIWRRINAISNSFNSAINFVIYCLLGRGFRRRVVATVMQCCHANRVAPVEVKTSYTEGSGDNQREMVETKVTPVKT